MPGLGENEYTDGLATTAAIERLRNSSEATPDR
jgi:hypothetical protein